MLPPPVLVPEGWPVRELVLLVLLLGFPLPEDRDEPDGLGDVCEGTGGRVVCAGGAVMGENVGW